MQCCLHNDYPIPSSIDRVVSVDVIFISGSCLPPWSWDPFKLLFSDRRALRSIFLFSELLSSLNKVKWKWSQEQVIGCKACNCSHFIGYLSLKTHALSWHIDEECFFHLYVVLPFIFHLWTLITLLCVTPIYRTKVEGCHQIFSQMANFLKLFGIRTYTFYHGKNCCLSVMYLLHGFEFQMEHSCQYSIVLFIIKLLAFNFLEKQWLSLEKKLMHL